MKEPRFVGAFALVILLACIAGVARADAWNEDTVTWTPPATCNDGTPVSGCPVTGYRVETAASKTATNWTLAATVGLVTTVKITGLSPGPHCYRVIAVGANGPSTATVQSNDCPVAVQPPPTVPGPPGNVQTVETIAYNVRPNLQRFVFERGSRYGRVRLGAACDESRVTVDGYTVIANRRSVFPRPPEAVVLVARCG